MLWNWQQKEWPHLQYENQNLNLADLDKKFLQGSGGILAILNHFNIQEKNRFIVELLSVEGLKSAQIEGEILAQESLQSSILRHFGLKGSVKNIPAQEKGMADLMYEVYVHYKKPLSHELLFQWHYLLMKHHPNLEDLGKYRSHEDPMQIVSTRYGHGNLKVHFEAPPSKIVEKEMERFIDWFNRDSKESILGKAAKAHVYFESIHPFEDGNGRIGRALVEKLLSIALDHPTLIAISETIESQKKEYYSKLAGCNRSLNISHWVKFFAEVILEAQENSFKKINFLMQKTKLMTSLAGSINARQEKALLRIFAEGIDGFKGGLSAENYITITKASRATATRDLTELVEKGALIKTGTLRHTRYWLPA